MTFIIHTHYTLFYTYIHIIILVCVSIHVCPHYRNLLLNVGPMADGTLDPIFEERLLEMGAWLNISGEAIYDSIPWKYQNDTPAKDIWYTASKVS